MQNRCTRLACVITRRKPVSGQAEAEYAADVALAAQFEDLLAKARAAEQAFRRAQARALPVSEVYPLARNLDTALTDAMRAAYAAERAEIGPRGTRTGSTGGRPGPSRPCTPGLTRRSGC